MDAADVVEPRDATSAAAAARPGGGMTVAVVGCTHGELDVVYDAVREAEASREGLKVDLVLCCGDFEAVRNEDDLECMAVPERFKHLKTFWKYYKGERRAPVPTLFIGGNHEASNHMLELFYGGWAAPNMYYLGHAGVVRFGGLRIAGLTGIYKGRDYARGHHERPPYDSSSMRSAYHVRAFEEFRLSQLAPRGDEPAGRRLDVMMSHDWPRGIARLGNTAGLLRRKTFLRREVEDNSLGSPPGERLLAQLRPDYWFAAHLHVKFAALAGRTKFLALDKTLPGRDFMQLLHFPDADPARGLEYDPEWLAVLRSTHALTPLTRGAWVPPATGRADFRPTAEELEWVRDNFGPLAVPDNFAITVLPHDPARPRRGVMPRSATNPQTAELLRRLGLDDLIGGGRGGGQGSGGGGAAAAPAESAVPVVNPDEISLDDDDDDDDEGEGDGNGSDRAATAQP